MKLGGPKPTRLRDYFPPIATDQALDLLAKMLTFHPGKRISIDDALKHPFMQNLPLLEDEPALNSECCFKFEEEKLSRHRLQELMWEEMRRYHPE
ncbi:unnamed protein product, partial [Sphacelaria rigidula]